MTLRSTFHNNEGPVVDITPSAFAATFAKHADGLSITQAPVLEATVDPGMHNDTETIKKA